MRVDRGSRLQEGWRLKQTFIVMAYFQRISHLRPCLVVTPDMFGAFELELIEQCGNLIANKNANRHSVDGVMEGGVQYLAFEGHFEPLKLQSPM